MAFSPRYQFRQPGSADELLPVPPPPAAPASPTRQAPVAPPVRQPPVPPSGGPSGSTFSIQPVGTPVVSPPMPPYLASVVSPQAREDWWPEDWNEGWGDPPPPEETDPPQEDGGSADAAPSPPPTPDPSDPSSYPPAPGGLWVPGETYTPPWWDATGPAFDPPATPVVAPPDPGPSGGSDTSEPPQAPTTEPPSGGDEGDEPPPAPPPPGPTDGVPPHSPPVMPSPEDALAAQIMANLNAMMTGGGGRYTPEVVESMRTDLLRATEGRRSAAEARADEDAAARGLFRSGILSRSKGEIERGAASDYATGVRNILTEKVNADHEDRMAALDRSQRWLDSQRQYLLAQAANQNQRDQWEAQIALGYAQIEAERERLQAQLEAQVQLLQMQIDAAPQGGGGPRSDPFDEFLQALQLMEGFNNFLGDRP